MPTIQSADLWRESGRYEDYGKEMLRIKDRHERDMLYGPTNEEMITEIFRAYVRSYKDLPLNLYHLQWKFRDEVRPRFGTMRVARIPDEGRLFLRPRFRRRAARLQPHVRRLSAHLCADGIACHSDGRRHRADRRQSQPRIHHPRLHRRERGLLPPRLSRLRHPRGRREFRRRRGDPAPRRHLDLALRRDLRKARGRRLRCAARRRQDVRARHRGRPHLLFRHQIFRRR